MAILKWIQKAREMIEALRSELISEKQGVHRRQLNKFYDYNQKRVETLNLIDY